MTWLLIPLFALISLFIFPWQVSLAALFAAALSFPPSGIALGLLADLLYFVPGSAFMPYITLFGLLSTAASLLVHRFVKTRIMDA